MNQIPKHNDENLKRHRIEDQSTHDEDIGAKQQRKDGEEVNDGPISHIVSTSRRGKVLIASFNLRGQWATRPDGYIVVNVTSSQAKDSLNRLAFSPMTPVTSGYRGYWNFEAFWQSGKVFKDVPESKSKKYWKEVREPKRRYPGSKGKEVLFAKFDGFGDEKMDYLTSRKRVYVPLYDDFIKDNSRTKYWIEQVESGRDIVVYDMDGPRNYNAETGRGDVTCVEVTEELLMEKINDTRFPFGHGYVCAARFAGIDISKFLSS